VDSVSAGATSDLDQDIYNTSGELIEEPANQTEEELKEEQIIVI